MLKSEAPHNDATLLWELWSRVDQLFDSCDEPPLVNAQLTVRKLDLSHLCFSLNFSFSMFPCLFPSMFSLLTYSQSFFSLSADHPRHTRQRRSEISILLIQETV